MELLLQSSVDEIKYTYEDDFKEIVIKKSPLFPTFF